MENLHLSKNNWIIGGVCGGLAESFDWDPSLVRIIFTLILLAGFPIIIYILLWIILPTE